MRLGCGCGWPCSGDFKAYRHINEVNFKLTRKPFLARGNLIAYEGPTTLFFSFIASNNCAWVILALSILTSNSPQFLHH